MFRLSTFGIAAIVGLLALSGCQEQAKPSVYATRDRLDNPRVVGRPHSLVFDAPRLRDLASTSTEAGELPWYAYRNDVKPTVADGVESPTLDAVTTWTYDRISSSSGRVYENFHQTSYRSTVRETAR